MKAIDYIRIALALEVLSYHDRNYLSYAMCQPKHYNEEMQSLLKSAEKALVEEQKKFNK